MLTPETLDGMAQTHLSLDKLIQENLKMDEWVRSERYTTCLPTHCSPAEKRKQKCANYKIKKMNMKTKDKQDKIKLVIVQSKSLSLLEHSKANTKHYCKLLTSYYSLGVPRKAVENIKNGSYRYHVCLRTIRTV